MIIWLKAIFLRTWTFCDIDVQDVSGMVQVSKLPSKLSTRIYAGIDECPCFSTFYCCDPINWKLQLFSYTCFFSNNYNIGELTSIISKERMTTNIIFVGSTPINYWKVHMPVSFVFVYAHLATQRYRQRKSMKSVSSYLKYQKIHLWQHISLLSVSHSKGERAITLRFQCSLTFYRTF